MSKKKDSGKMERPLAGETDIHSLIKELKEIRSAGVKFQKSQNEALGDIHPDFEKSAKNFLRYLGLRQQDIRQIQKRLGNLGVSRLGRAEGHIEASLKAIIHNLNKLSKDPKAILSREARGFRRGRFLLDHHTLSLLGPEPESRSVRIMVTLPFTAANDYELVKNMLLAGMNLARVNCAHDTPAEWKQMIDNLRKAEKETGKTCKVCMDLAGPKFRTGPVPQSPGALKVRAKKDPFGNIRESAKVWISSQNSPENLGNLTHIPAEEFATSAFSSNDTLRFKDTRKKKRSFRILEVFPEGILAETKKTSYLRSGLVLAKKNAEPDEQEATITVGELPPTDNWIDLHIGDTLVIEKGNAPAENTVKDEKGQVLSPARISCEVEHLYTDTQIGEPILLDDGSIEGIITHKTDEELTLEIDYTKPGGARLKADKGINAPESDLGTKGLTEKDKEDLRFVVQHADIVNFSFVNRPEDVQDLENELEIIKKELDAPQTDDLGVILKIETRKGFKNLPSILLQAMGRKAIGVMLARGDLAVECGWNNLAETQEEILRICSAAHVPIVWATQVLEGLAKKGRPSRAEISDVALGQRAECVMLNKGPFIIDAISALDNIIASMQQHRQKMAPMLPGLDMEKFHSKKDKKKKQKK
ncbi:pyruvate kinase [Fulvitalea axinellae]|uniref:pyruvate kinase n=1 Tax=Fulvitalea axinellae TaxID=1182444 RepID=A0AAU9CZI9_9BACT|nr:pyruvate kinase [Fulvitalea axinellae]